MTSTARVAIVGRPNVGKSTLFNRITGTRRSLVHATPGVTRDAQSAVADWNGVVFELVDTGGLFSGIDDELVHQVEDRALSRAMESDVVILVTDAEAGLVPPDVDVAQRIRQMQAPVLVAVNKSEKRITEGAGAEFFRLGFDRVFPVSAMHGYGIGDLLDALVAALPKGKAPKLVEDMKLAIVGRPNVGKSSLANAIVGREANIVDSRPGTTRDSLDIRVKWHGRFVTLIDTAGLARKSRSKDGLTSLTALKSIDTISRADVVLAVLDGSQGIAGQDVKVASYAHKAGKGILICVNKWDLVSEKTNATVPAFEREIRRGFGFAAYAPILFVSALTAQRVSRILEVAWRVKQSHEKRVTTGELNRFLQEVGAHSPPPFHGGGNGRIYYGTQVGVRPPTFTLFVNRRAFFSRSYLRYINNRIRDRYGFEGTVVRIKLNEREKGGRRA